MQDSGDFGDGYRWERQVREAREFTESNDRGPRRQERDHPRSRSRSRCCGRRPPTARASIRCDTLRVAPRPPHEPVQSRSPGARSGAAGFTLARDGLGAGHLRDDRGRRVQRLLFRAPRRRSAASAPPTRTSACGSPRSSWAGRCARRSTTSRSHDEEDVAVLPRRVRRHVVRDERPQSQGGTGLAVVTYRLVERTSSSLEERTSFTPTTSTIRRRTRASSAPCLLEGFTSLRFEYLPARGDGSRLGRQVGRARRGHAAGGGARHGRRLAVLRRRSHGCARSRSSPWRYGWGTDEFQEPPTSRTRTTTATSDAAQHDTRMTTTATTTTAGTTTDGDRSTGRDGERGHRAPAW